MTAVNTESTGIVQPHLNKRQFAAVVIGNGLEFYDFMCFVFFAVQIGRSFFPAADTATSLLMTLGTFGAGFVTRPLGALVLGRLADRRGRRTAMMLSFSMMGVAILGLALTPPYVMIGLAAPILVMLFSLLQGFALGGEVGPTTAIWSKPRHPRGAVSTFRCSR